MSIKILFRSKNHSLKTFVRLVQNFCLFFNKYKIAFLHFKLLKIQLLTYSHMRQQIVGEMSPLES